MRFRVDKSKRRAGLTAVACLAAAAAALVWAGAREANRINRDRDLVLAVMSGDEPAVKRLLDAGADPDAANDFQKSHCSLRYGVKLVVARLLRRPTRRPEGHLVTSLAAQRGMNAICELLLDRGAGLNRRDFFGRTILAVAARSANSELVANLLARGADRTPRDVDGLSAYDAALANPYPVSRQDADNFSIRTKLAETLRPPERPASLIDAAQRNDTAAVAEMEGRDDIDGADAAGRTPLMIGCAFDNGEIVRSLLSREADVKRTDRNGCTALMWAAADGDVALAQALIGHGANPAATDHSGRTALHWAALNPRRNHGEMFRLLLARGARVDALDNQGRSALMYEAAHEGDGAAVLVGAGADCNRTDAHGVSSRFVATLCGHRLVRR
jgi:ankyrin repeat protein